MPTKETPDQYPVDSFKAAAPLLRRPFSVGAVKWKVQSTAGTKGLVVGYIDSRLVTERLNLVCPAIWHDEYEQINGNTMLCRLTLGGLTRQDVGESPKGIGKDIYSDAFKRAAVKFGVGVSLYAMKAIWLSKGPDLKEITTKKGKSLALTETGEKHLRELYGKWLKLERGGKVFGTPLDHGDDPEGSVGEAVDTAPEQAEPQPEPIDQKRLAAQVDEAEAEYKKLTDQNGRKKMTPGNFTASLNAAQTHEDMDALIARVKELQA